MNEVVLKYLQKQGYKGINTTYINDIEYWKRWRDDEVEEFNTYIDQNKQKRKMYTLGMAKRVAEDWSSTLYSDKDEIKTNKKSNEEYIKKIVKDLNIKSTLSKNIENAFALGEVATIVRAENVTNKNGVIKANEESKITLLNVDSDHIINLKVENDKVIDVAFVSEQTDSTDNKKKIYYIELHKLEKTGYVIHNIFIDSDGKEIVKDGIARTYNTNSKTPLFSILKPNITNNIKNNNGKGISIYANAINELKTVDTIYHNFIMDFYLGGKKIIYDRKLVSYKDVTINGKTVSVPVYPDDVTKQQFLCTNSEDMSLVNEKPLMHEYNPDLRVDDNIRGLEFALNLLAFKCGLGKNRYKFENGNIMTATQYVGQNQDFVKNAKKHRDAVNDYIISIFKSIIYIAKTIFNENVVVDSEVTIINKDGFLMSETEIKEEDRKALSLGLLSKTSYLMRYRGLTEEEAKEELKRIEEENTIQEIEV